MTSDTELEEIHSHNERTVGHNKDFIDTPTNVTGREDVPPDGGAFHFH